MKQTEKQDYKALTIKALDSIREEETLIRIYKFVIRHMATVGRKAEGAASR